MDQLLPSLPYLIPLAFVLFWCAILSVIARFGGWSELAEHYPADNDYDGPRKRFQSIGLQRLRSIPVSVNNVAEVGVDGSYLRLSMFVLFRPFHPPLRIPFSDLSSQSRRIFLVESIAFVAARTPGIQIVVSRGLAEWIAVNAGGGLLKLEAQGSPASARARDPNPTTKLSA